MKLLIVLSLLASLPTFAQTKAKNAVIPASVQTHEAQKKVAAKTAEAPCDTKEDVLKKLEEQKKAQEAQGKGFALQGAKDTGCSIK